MLFALAVSAVLAWSLACLRPKTSRPLQSTMHSHPSLQHDCCSVVTGDSTFKQHELCRQYQNSLLRVKEGAPVGHTPDAALHLAALGRASLLPLGEEDTRKARDAVIVAIGISSVLNINVAYVGYITTPGGPDPYWADCFYPVFVAYFLLNGFALVFSVAALCAVTWGPFVLIWRRVSTWRTRVVNLGLAHLAVSLASLLGAFACAGFVAASVGAPEVSCGNLRCTEGGVPCSPFSVRSDGLLYVGIYGWVPSHYALDPVRLNNATFADLKARSAPGGTPAGAGGVGQGVVCYSYSHVAALSDLVNMTGKACAPRCASQYDGQHGAGSLYDADGGPINTTCFVLADPNAASLSFEPSLNPYTYWCSLNGSGLGPGWLPLQWGAAAQLLETAGPGYFEDYNNTLDVYNERVTNDGYAINGPQGQGASSCPYVAGYDSLATSLMTQARKHGMYTRGVELLASAAPVTGLAGSCKPWDATPDITGIYAYILTLSGLSPDIHTEPDSTCRIAANPSP